MPKNYMFIYRHPEDSFSLVGGKDPMHASFASIEEIIISNTEEGGDIWGNDGSTLVTANGLYELNLDEDKYYSVVE